MDESERKALARYLGESASALLEEQLGRELNGFGRSMPPMEGVTRGEVVYVALDENWRTRFARLLDRQKDAQSFLAYLNKHRSEVEEVAEKLGIDVTRIENEAENWKNPRNKTIAHISVDSVDDPMRIWKEADLKYATARDCLRDIWKICNALYPADSQIQVRPPKFLKNDPKLRIDYAESPDPLEG